MGNTCFYSSTIQLLSGIQDMIKDARNLKKQQYFCDRRWN